MAGDDDEMFITRSLNVTPKTTEWHLVARSDEPVTYVTNNKRLRSTFRKLKLTTDRHEALSINQSINQYVFSAPSTQVRADEALQMSSQYTYS